MGGLAFDISRELARFSTAILLDDTFMARIDTTQDIILARIVARLRSELELPDNRCFEVLVPLDDPAIPKGGAYFLTVSPGAGRFDEGMQDAAGADQLMEKASVTVTAYSKVALDPGDRATEILHETDRGMLNIKRLILAALVGHDLQDSEGNYILRAYLYALQSWAPQYNPISKTARIAVAFGTDFDWDLNV